MVTLESSQIEFVDQASSLIVQEADEFLRVFHPAKELCDNDRNQLLALINGIESSIVRIQDEIEGLEDSEKEKDLERLRRLTSVKAKLLLFLN